MYAACEPKAVKTLLAIKPGDTIVGVAQKIDENRETIRRVVDQLENDGYVAYDDGLSVVDEAVRESGRQFLATSARVAPPAIPDAYILPHFAGMDFAYTGIDAVYIWTRGGYQVARTPDEYPLFIAVAESDRTEWERFFDRFGIPVAQERQPRDEIEGAIQIVLDPQPAIEAELVDGRPVISLEETVAFAREHYATFQSALALLDQMYDEVDSDTDSRGDRPDHEPSKTQ
jgi:hypothetical protein